MRKYLFLHIVMCRSGLFNLKLLRDSIIRMYFIQYTDTIICPAVIRSMKPEPGIRIGPIKLKKNLN
jgi:hypothetical protein